MCEVCRSMAKLGLRGPHYDEIMREEKESYRDYLVNEKAKLVSRLQTIDMLLNMMDANPEIEKFMVLAEQTTKKD